jgi:2-octaprenyl-6-methoxyphenol hydroxylase
VSVAQVFTRSGMAMVGLTDGHRIEARLLIGADGRNSAVRTALGIGVRTWRYGQKALTCAVTHAAPHDNISTEVHRSGGPFTLVPLPDRDGHPCSALVWMDHAGDTMARLALSEPAFEAAMTERSAGLYGPLRLASRRTAWPIISQLADRMTGERTALMAEAAHVVPPIGAQGLNMSLADLALLLHLAQSDSEALGSAAMLDAYHKGRHGELLARVIGVDALNRASMIGAPALRDLRAGALAGLYALGPLRRQVMRAGLGLRST